MRIKRIVGELPTEFEALRAEARAENHRFLDRLANDWATGTLRFGRPGEVLLAAYSGAVLAGIGGITTDPVVPQALRMRRFYVRARFRRTGIGRALAQTLLEEALRTAPIVLVNAAPDSVRFWESLGFVPDVRDGHTHRLSGGGRKKDSEAGPTRKRNLGRLPGKPYPPLRSKSMRGSISM